MATREDTATTSKPPAVIDVDVVGDRVLATVDRGDVSISSSRDRPASLARSSRNCSTMCRRRSSSSQTSSEVVSNRTVGMRVGCYLLMVSCTTS
jgi:hypothetical protein